ncbi:MAG: ergothioneine biosynthesis protein EgtC [Leptolyngbyaceae cyanobacterium T60_A2020_046]|nr:ergothioneine biosynthesis protein EgtC [Leptolyngbyaceae cyanobacterium T60_A2020_046]
MCRLLGYVGSPISLGALLTDPPHSLRVQSYAPRELRVALLNADGFGFGWYDGDRDRRPFTYRSILPLWNDPNVDSLCRYIHTPAAIAYVRSATPGQTIDHSNCQPFQSGELLFSHNGYIHNFRETLYRPLRSRLSDRAYAAIQGSTDSEHLWGLVLTALEQTPDLRSALAHALNTLADLAVQFTTAIAANILMSDGTQLIGAKFSSFDPSPSLYWLRGDPRFPNSAIVASEPLFEADWQPCPEATLFTISAHRDPEFHPLQPTPSSI